MQARRLVSEKEFGYLGQNSDGDVDQRVSNEGTEQRKGMMNEPCVLYEERWEPAPEPTPEVALLSVGCPGQIPRITSGP